MSEKHVLNIIMEMCQKNCIKGSELKNYFELQTHMSNSMLCVISLCKGALAMQKEDKETV